MESAGKGCAECGVLLYEVTPDGRRCVLVTLSPMPVPRKDACGIPDDVWGDVWEAGMDGV